VEAVVSRGKTIAVQIPAHESKGRWQSHRLDVVDSRVIEWRSSMTVYTKAMKHRISDGAVHIAWCEAHSVSTVYPVLVRVVTTLSVP